MKIIRFVALLLLSIALMSACQKQDIQIPFPDPQSSFTYHTFESVLELASDIVKARLLAVTDYEGNKDYEFQVLKNYVGSNEDGTIHMYVMKRSAEEASGYEIGKDYFLMLVKCSDVYYPHIKYLNCGVFLPCEDLSRASMYDEPIAKHSQLENVKHEEELVKYIVDYLQACSSENRYVDMGNPFIQSTDLQTVITQAEAVVVVKAKKESVDSDIIDAWDRDHWICTVQEGIKGKWEEGSEITIILPKNTVKAETEYVIALRSSSRDVYALAAPNSMYDLSTLPEIREYLNVG
jgi:hypothetical protein